MWDYRYSMMGYGIGWIFMLGILVLIILGIWALIRYIKGSSYRNMSNYHKNNAMDILNERYAKGEIGEDEYNKIKSNIESKKDKQM
jgi:putative membrane protein